MKVKVTAYFKEVEFETEVDNNLSKEELQEKISDEVFIFKEEELLQKTEVENFDYTILEGQKDKQC